MADQKAMSNGYLDVWAVPVAGIVDYRSPTAAEINAGIRLTPAIAWDGTTFPASTDSDDVDDRSLEDKGNATTRGAAQFEATINGFYPKNLNENLTDYGKMFTFFRVPRVPVYLVTRVLQRTPGVVVPAAAGQWISVFRFLSDGWTDDVADDDSYKYAISMLAQGEVAVYTQVKNATPPTVLPATLAVTTAGPAKTLRATLGGKRATQTVIWTSANPAIATVSQNGVVRGISAGSTTVTCTHPSATGSSTAAAVTVT